MSSPADESPSPPAQECSIGMPVMDIDDDQIRTPAESDGNSHHASSSFPSQKTVHDLLSSGEIESALSTSTFSPSKDEDSPSDGTSIPLKGKHGGDSLAIRLPLLLRWLSVAQPLATLSPTLDDGKATTPSTTSLPDPNAIVPLLEDVAAAHHDAENVEVCVSALAPSICKDTFANKLSPLSRNKLGATFLQRKKMMGKSCQVVGNPTTWNTIKLDNAMSSLTNNIASSKHSHKRPIEQGDATAGKKPKVGDQSDPLLLEKDDDADAHSADRRDGSDQMTSHIKEEVVAPSSFFAQASSAANDSHESAMRRVLQELIGLVKSSLRTRNDGSCSSNDDSGGVEGGGDDDGRHLSASDGSNPFFWATGFSTPGLALKSDSLFAETHELSSSLGGGWSRLSVVIPTLMHHAPILRHEHVANALCRATAPQAPTLIKDMAANCPSATQCLLQGCITAYQLAEKFELLSSSKKTTEEADPHTLSDLAVAKNIMRASVESAKYLASLSCREALNVIRTLHEQRVMDGLALSLLMIHDPIGAVSYIVEKLYTKEPTSSNRNAIQHKRRHALPLRQRVLSSQSRTQPSVKGVSVPINTVTSKLCKELTGDKALAENVRCFISRRISLSLKNKQTTGSISMGEGALFIQAYALLVHSIGIGAGSSSGSGSKFVEDTMTAIGKLLTNENSGQDLPTRSSEDNIYKTAICAAIVTCSRYPPIADSDGSVIGGPAVIACLDCLRGLFLRPRSIESAIFSSRFAGALIGDDAASFGKMALVNIFSHTCSTENIHQQENDSQMAGVCRWLSSKIEMCVLKGIHQKGLTFVMHDPTATVEAMSRNSSKTSNELDDLMKKILADPKLCADIIQHKKGCALVHESVMMLVRRPSPHIPLVLPLSLERLAQSLPWDVIGSDNHTAQQSQLALQIVYALKFLDCQPQSPFVINPRLVPLKESLAFMESCNKNGSNGIDSGFGALCIALKELISKHCPDTLHAIDSCTVGRETSDGLMVSPKHTVNPMIVSDAIRDCLSSCDGVDPSGLRAEKMFMICRSKHPSFEVDVAAVGAILSSLKSQPKFYSYMALCKDPLIILKSRAAAWKCRGLRSIILRILEDLMSANECIAVQSSASESVALEYLTARDTIIVRCIVFACASGFTFGGCKNGGTPCSKHCMLSVSMIRSIVSKRRGIIAALAKQDLPDNCIDWIVEFVPESLSDAPDISFLLSEKGMLTATQRLTAASAGLRIAVAHSPRGEAIANNLMLASTAVLLDSFALVVGPIGVPVSVLREENGQDVTNVCRKAMFDMLKTIATISPKNIYLKNEAIITLSKIASQCKSENAAGGISGVAASRRKALLKEIWETCLQANTALGGAMQL